MIIPLAGLLTKCYVYRHRYRKPMCLRADGLTKLSGPDSKIITKSFSKLCNKIKLDKGRIIELLTE